MNTIIKAVWIESSHRWMCKVQREGRRRSFYCSTPGRKGRAECERKAREWVVSGVANGNQRVSTLFDRYLDNIKRLSGSSTEHYRQNEKLGRLYIKPAIGSKKLENVTDGHLQAIIDNACAERNLSAKYLKDIRGCISGFLGYCRRYKLTNLSIEFITIPKSAKKSEKTILQPESIRKLFMSNSTDDFYLYRYRFAVVTGLRPGELTGLQWDDIKCNALRIRRSVNSQGEITEGKNANARRTICLSETQSGILQQQYEMLTAKGIDSIWVFPNTKGSISTQKVVRRAWKRFCQSNDIPYVTPYELRHTWVSMNDNMPEGLKRRVVGHSQSMDTEGVYGHTVNTDGERIAEYTEQMLDRILERK